MPLRSVFRRRRRLAAVFLWVLPLCAGVPLRGDPVLPDPAAARQFAAGLVRDYAAHGGSAIVDRFDADAALALIYRGELPAALRAVQEKGVPVWFGHEVGELRDFPILGGVRVILADDARWLECQFVSKGAALPLLARLRLASSASGAVRISDIYVGGDTLSFAQRMRDVDLLRGVHVHAVTDDELALWSAGRDERTTVLNAFQAYGRGDFNRAYQSWKSLHDIEDTAIWQYYRNAMAFHGCMAARGDVGADIRAGRAVDPFVSFHVGIVTNDPPATLRALDEILDRYDAPLLYRCSRANVLLAMHLPLQAYKASVDVIDLMPGATFAYETAVKAAVVAGVPESAVAVLKRWALVTPPITIDTLLKADTAVPRAFFTSVEYLGWFGSALSPQTQASK